MGFIKEMLIPQIYLLKDRKQFVYTRGEVRIVFDHLELFEDQGAYNEINTLFLLKPRGVDEYSDKSHIVFDLGESASAVIPYSSKSFFYGSGSIYLYRGNKAERMTMARFFKDQHDILNESSTEGPNTP